MNTKVEITFNRFLDPIFAAYIQAQEQWEDWQPLPMEETVEKIEKYKEYWEKEESIILQAIEEITGLTFINNVIRAHIVRGNPRSFSKPIVMKVSYPELEFVDVLTHELIHVILSENKPNIAFLNNLTDRRNDSTRIHVLIHAIHKKIYLEYLESPERLDSNIERSEKYKNDEYITSWEIVDELGYNVIIEKLKDSQKL